MQDCLCTATLPHWYIKGTVCTLHKVSLQPGDAHVRCVMGSIQSHGDVDVTSSLEQKVRGCLHSPCSHAVWCARRVLRCWCSSIARLVH